MKYEDLTAIVCWVSPIGKRRDRPATAAGVRTAREHKRNGFTGAWRLTSMKPEALRQVKHPYIRPLLKELANTEHRGAIKAKITQMGASCASNLEVNQLGTFNNFLLKIKASKL